ncbi:hypothetical protein D9615_004591 [Tricholomella constricta]|uniref:Transcription factor domain-containing protein n=1 Tax=Tricholomella constricta TaxID=117010 RepID=A0A8H5M422_9AGAR|nr:hypothetical protein D9615_004591 [Tricholomella constricta]
MTDTLASPGASKKRRLPGACDICRKRKMDLLMALVDVYFDHVNVHMPLLHRHSFEKSLAENFHFLDPSFGATVLLVCAVASRHVIDPRVPILRNYTLHKANIYDLQYYCLAAMYLFGTSVPNASWILLGLGTLEPTWHIAGRLWDMLNELANVREPQVGKLVPRRDPKQHILEPRGVTFLAQVEASTSSLESQMSGATGWGDSAALFSQPEDHVPHPPISVLDQNHDPHLVAADIGLHTHDFPHIPAFRGEHLPTPPMVEHEGCAWDKAGSDNTSSNQSSRPIEEQFAISMWSNAPTGFKQVVHCSRFLSWVRRAIF